MTRSASDDSILGELLTRWEEARNRGETLAVEQLCRDRHELADELSRQIQVLREWEHLATPSSTRSPNALDLAEMALAGGETSAIVTAELRDLHFHARGGVGRIYKARQTGLSRDVALKFMRKDRARDPEIMARFLREAEITARLEHPGIVPIYGLGQDEAGNPCYAMRFIQGTTLDKAIKTYYAGPKSDQRRGPHETDRAFRALLQRFKAACTTVAYAHSRGVLHRDLKPANMMLGPFEETLVVDWGLGKSIGTDAATVRNDTQEAFTPAPGCEDIQSRGFIGTPGFISPEQRAGLWEKVGPASDIYSLGATLYVLLTGKTPSESRSPVEIAAEVQQRILDPPRQMNPDLPRELNAVCLKAMAFEPVNRYGSALELAADLENWLAGEPVTAWRDPWLVRMRRFLGRQLTLVWGLRTVSILAAITVVAFMVHFIWSNRELTRTNDQLRIANREVEQSRNRAEGEFDLALRAIEHFHRAVTLNLDVKDRPDLKPLRTELLQAPMEFYRLLKQDLQEHDERHPEVAARFADAVAGLAQITGDIDSEPNAIRAYKDAIDVLNRLNRDHPDVAKYSSALARVLLNLGRLQLDTNRVEDALVSNERALALYQRLARDYPADERYRFGLARVDNQIGLTKRTAHRPDEALASYRQALVVIDELVRDNPTEDLYKSELAHILRNRGVLERASQEPEAAMASYQQAQAAFQTLVLRHPTIASYRQGLANSYFNIANLQIDAGRPQEAMKSLAESRRVQEGLVRDYPTVVRFQADLAHNYGQIGAIQYYQGRTRESLVDLGEARKILLGMVRDHPDVPIYRLDLALTHFYMGKAYNLLSRCTEAIYSFEQTCDVLCGLDRERAIDFKTRHMLASAWEEKGDVMIIMGRHADSAAAYDQATLHQARAYGQAPSNDALRRRFAMQLEHQYEKLAGSQVLLNHPAEASTSLCRARDILINLPDPSPLESYVQARVCGRLYNILDGEPLDLTGAQQTKKQELLDEALAGLRRAVSGEQTDFVRLMADKDFDSLRSTTDFQMFMADLAFPANPFAR